jgi:hypothetical protein
MFDEEPDGDPHGECALEIKRLRATVERLTAERDAMQKTGPIVQRGVTSEGSVWLGTMLDVLTDYKSAADVEAKLGDEARAERDALKAALSEVPSLPAAHGVFCCAENPNALTVVFKRRPTNTELSNLHELVRFAARTALAPKGE